jgi:hypothetical protein
MATEAFFWRALPNACAMILSEAFLLALVSSLACLATPLISVSTGVVQKAFRSQAF